ncbi:MULTISPECIES: ABC transporter ATP-binding protein [Aerococcus]|uniref:ABC transporter ATP-binding protein n=1 Tax=Aerococcus TaxID=1375 RepID=UPI000200ED95|nr:MULTISPECIES: ABC transporter ATP-binding protein [Aerococcus]AEA00835.1 ABC transporter, ATP-binding protein [Aerococcus sp. Group 1]MCY3055401.1 ABC transporter ATP-binding protein/permease [Aerococcus sp. Group 1]MCY3057131.1 ABC transporter ATP-binding protein/permease [Aerococcus sp. Group 1]MCY3061416.1 ABC transporter ATP-binding protein/permease [Aerococcus sp. Group 1]
MENNRQLMKSLWHFISPYRFKFSLSVICTIVLCLSNVLEPIVLGLAITEISKNILAIMNNVPGAGINYDYLLKIMALYFLRGIFYHGSFYLSQYWLTEVVQHSIYDLRNAISHKANRLPVSYFDKNQTGDILSRMTNDVDTLSNALQQSVLPLLTGVLQISFALISMFILHWKLALVSVISMPITYLSAKTILNYSQPIFKKQADALGHLFGYTQEQLSGYTEIKVYNKENESVDEFEKRNQNLQEVGFKAAFLAEILQPILSFISNLAYIVITGLGAYFVFIQQLTIGNLQAFVQYVWQINQPIQTITQLIGVIQSAVAASQRIFTFLGEEEVYQKPVTEHLPLTIKGQISFDHVKFAYDEDNILMHDVSFTVEPGQTVAIVGPTGAGKTTLINLLMRFYDVQDGSINVDGINIKDISRHDLRSHIGMVLQDAWLYTDTIRENIRLGDLEASDYEVIDAAKIANVDHFIRTLPGGYDMEINEEGSNVSLGQKQLMTIARAIVSDPDILILDEATSSVDTRLEQLIQSAMDRIMENRTSFVIAHRLSTIRNADIILVMKNGDIIEHGNHDSLMAKDGFYADLYNSQFNQESAAEIHMGY